jgi:hypothetical protein
MTETASKNDRPFTHEAWIKKTEFVTKGRRVGRWILEGVARQEPDGSIDVYLHSLPIGGWGGHIWLGKPGTKPPDAMPAPQRPHDADNADETSEN